MTKMKIDDIIINMDVYPRKKWNKKLIAKYVFMLDHTVAPPIIVNKDNKLVDGIHRLKAAKEKGLTEIEVKIEDIDDKMIKIESAAKNDHGLRLSNSELAVLAREYCIPKDITGSAIMTQQDFANKLGIPDQQRVSEWVTEENDNIEKIRTIIMKIRNDNGESFRSISKEFGKSPNFSKDRVRTFTGSGKTAHETYKLLKKRPDLVEKIIKKCVSITKNSIGNSIEINEDYIEKMIEPWSSFEYSEHSPIFNMNLLGYNTSLIAKQLNKTEEEIITLLETSDLIDQFNKKVESGNSVEMASDLSGITYPLGWNIHLTGLDDLERFTIFGKSKFGNDSPKVYDYWNFVSRDDRFRSDYAGFCFGQVLMNVLYQWTKIGDKVVDPMAGGGSMADACLIMGRKFFGSDYKPISTEIIKHDIRDGYLPEAKDCDMIWLDPPYYDKEKDNYNCYEIMESKDNFIKFMKKLSKDSYDTIKDGGRVILIYGNYTDYDEPEESIYTADLYKLFMDVGFKCEMVIQSPLSGSAQYTASHIEYAKEHKKLLVVSRDIYVFKKI